MVRLVVSILSVAFSVLGVAGAKDPGGPKGSGYNQVRRPQVHFSPPKNFMNDPNGLFYHNGTYHMYYQWDATANVAGNQHWGHATSPDLYHWQNHPPAIAPGAPGEGIFSGSAVIDVDNTSGFFGSQPAGNPGIVAIYTLNTPTSETQNIAYSTDGGYTFTKYSGNPVIDVNSNQFRDPKVIWHAPSNKWVMAVARPTEFTVVFYTSSDLKSWTKASEFAHRGWLGIQFECPNLVEIPVHNSNQQDSGETKWVLVVSINPGAPQGGSFTQFFPGEFDGTTFTPEDDGARQVDFGKDNYAMQFFYGTGKKTLGVGWVSLRTL
jgi:beta-fructofuranosidase